MKPIYEAIMLANWQSPQSVHRGSLSKPVAMVLVAVILPSLDLVSVETASLNDSPAVWISCEIVTYRLGTDEMTVVEANRQTLEAQLCASGFSISVFTDPGLSPVETIGFTSKREIWSLLNKKLHIADVVDAGGVSNHRSLGKLQQYAMQMKLLGFAKPLIGALDAASCESSATRAIRKFVDEFGPVTAASSGFRADVLRVNEGTLVPFEITTLAKIKSMELPISRLTCKALEHRSVTTDCEMPTAGFVGSPLIFTNGVASVDGNPIDGLHDASGSTFVRGMLILLILLFPPVISLIFWIKRRKSISLNQQ